MWPFIMNTIIVQWISLLASIDSGCYAVQGTVHSLWLTPKGLTQATARFLHTRTVLELHIRCPLAATQLWRMSSNQVSGIREQPTRTIS